MSEEIEAIFTGYLDVVGTDEAAAILTLAEVLKGKAGGPGAKAVDESGDDIPGSEFGR